LYFNVCVINNDDILVSVSSDLENSALRFVEKIIPELKVCPICEYIGKFEPSGVRTNEKAVRCPKCGSLERSRLYFLYLKKQNWSSDVPVRIIHFLPEQCIRYKINRKPGIDYTPLDISFKRLDFEDGTVDLVLANYVIDRAPDPSLMLKEIRRVLSSDGTALLSVFMKAVGESDFDSVPRKYGLDYLKYIEKYGFKTELISAADLCGHVVSYIYGINPKETIVVARKNHE
jgi:SAM-dependent methyltransferase